MDDPRIVELLTEMLLAQQQMLAEQKQTNVRLDHLESQQQTTNVAIRGLTLSTMRLADELRIAMELEGRVVRLEAAVFH